MRLIDADALKHRRGIAGDEILHEIIDTQPTIDAEPVRHGQWVKRKGVWGAGASVLVCSVCNSVAQSSYSEYCPGCGAKMEEAQE